MTTPTGIPITTCATCGHEHPITRGHCVDCGIATAFVDSAGVCLRCRVGEAS